MDTTLSVGSFLSFGWETFKKRPWFLAGGTVVYIILSWCVSFVSGFVGGFLGAFLAEGFAVTISFFVSFALSTLIAMGWIALFIKVHDDPASASLSDLWHPQRFWSYLGTTILLGIIVVVGFVLLIVPGFMALTAFMFAPYFILDKGLGPIEALKASARITKGNRLRVFALIAATSLVSLLGAIALLVGLLVAIPLMAVATIHAYRRLSAAADLNQARQPLSGGEIALAIVGMILPILIIVGLLGSVVLSSLNIAREKARAARADAEQKLLQLNSDYADTLIAP